MGIDQPEVHRKAMEPRLAAALAAVRSKVSPEPHAFHDRFTGEREDDPYVIERSRGDQRLVFFGSVHTNDPAHPEVAQIRASRDAFLATTSDQHAVRFFVEGHDEELNLDRARAEFHDRGIATEGDAVRTYGEGGVLLWRAVQDKIAVSSPEANEAEIVAGFQRDGFDSEDLALFLTLRQFSTDIDRTPPQVAAAPLRSFSGFFRSIQELTGVSWIDPALLREVERARSAGTSDEEIVARHGRRIVEQFGTKLNERFARYARTAEPLIPTVDALLALDRSAIPLAEASALWDPADLDHRGTMINQIATRWSIARDLHIVRELHEALERGESVFAVYGRSHAGAIEAAIDALVRA